MSLLDSTDDPELGLSADDLSPHGADTEISLDDDVRIHLDEHGI
jgi:hypothetical protein